MSRRRRKNKKREPRLTEDHPDYTPPACQHFGTCGGCRWQDHGYGAQLAKLETQLREVFEPLGDSAQSMQAIEGAPEIFGYRNKMDFTFAKRRWVEAHEPEGAFKDFALGLHVPGRFDKVLDVQECKIAFPEADSIVRFVREWALKHELTPWDVYAHEGCLRHLVTRKSFSEGDIMVQLVTTTEERENIDAMMGDLKEAIPEVTTAVQTINSGVAMVAVGDSERVIFGSGQIRESVWGREFLISPQSFFQTNTAQASRLAEIVAEEANLTSNDHLFDLCCGAGFFSILLADRVKTVHGFEVVDSAIDDAVKNAEHNEISATSFIAGDLLKTLSPDQLESMDIPKPTVCIVDPPRAGLHEKVARALIELGPERIVYVSCQPKAAMPNLLSLQQAGYEVQSIRPLDLFPQTPHVECVISMRRPG